MYYYNVKIGKEIETSTVSLTKDAYDAAISDLVDDFDFGITTHSESTGNYSI